MSKGEQTRQRILDRGMLYSSQQGLVDLSIGTMADLCGMSRTGVISHFGNKQEMQLAILAHAEAQFRAEVIRPSRSEDPYRQLETLLTLWVDWTHRIYESKQVSCPFIKALVDYEHRVESAVYEVVSDQQRRLIRFMTDLAGQAQQNGTLMSERAAEAIAFELYSIYVGSSIAISIQPPEDATSQRQQLMREALGRFRVS